MERWHATNSAINGHLLVAWVMAAHLYLWFGHGRSIGLAGFLCGATALACAHVTSGILYEDHGETSTTLTLRIVMLVAVAFAYALLILSAF